MKILLSILGSLGFTSTVGATSVVAYQNNNHQQADQNITGTIITNLVSEKNVKDWAMGLPAQDTANNSRMLRWKEFGVNDEDYNRIDFANSIIGLNIKHGYDDNSGNGNANDWETYEQFEIDRFWSSGIKEYNEDRHHGGNGRNTDHHWKYSVTIDAEGINLWNWVWVWANGNWGNVASSTADINIKSIYFNFQLL